MKDAVAKGSIAIDNRIIPPVGSAIWGGPAVSITRSAGPNLTHCGRGAKKHGAVQQGVFDQRNKIKERPAGSVRLDACELDHFGPLFGIVGNKLAEVGGGTWKHRRAQLGKPRLEPGGGQPSVDLLVELVDDHYRRISGHPDAIPRACLRSPARSRQPSASPATPVKLRW